MLPYAMVRVCIRPLWEMAIGKISSGVTVFPNNGSDHETLSLPYRLDPTRCPIRGSTGPCTDQFEQLPDQLPERSSDQARMHHERLGEVGQHGRIYTESGGCHPDLHSGRLPAGPIRLPWRKWSGLPRPSIGTRSPPRPLSASPALVRAATDRQQQRG